MADDKILIPIEADIDKLEKELKSAISSVNSELKTIKFASIISGIAGIIDIAASLRSSISGVFSDFIKEATQSQQATEKLNISLKLSGSFSDDAAKSFNNLASALQEQTTFSDEAALNSLSLAKNLGLTNDQAEKVVKTAADLAAVTGQSLVDATESLSKSIQGNGTQLQRQLPFLKGLTDEQLRAGAAVDILAQRFNGAAQAIAQTFSGSIQRTQNIFSDLLETLGGFIVQNPILIRGINEFGNIFKELNKFVTANSQSIRTFVDTALVGLIQGLVSVADAVSGTIRGLGIFFSVVSSGLSALLDAFEATIGPIVDLIGDVLIKSLLLATASILELTKSFSQLPGISEVFQSAGVDVNKFGKSVETANEKLFELANSFSGNKFRQEEKKILDGLAKDIPAGANKAANSIDALSGRFRTFASEAQKDIGKVAKSASESISNNIVLKPKINDAEFRSAFETGFKNIPAAIGLNLSVARLDIEAQDAQLLGATANVFGNVFKGAQGATQLFSQVTGQIADFIIPGIGSVVGQIVGVLAQGPEAAAGFVNGFISAIPTIIENIILSLPAVIEALVNGLLELPQKLGESLSESLPQVIGQLAAQMPFIAERFAFYMAVQAPFIARSFAFSFIKDGIPQIVKGFIEEIKNQFKSLGGLLGGGGGGGGGILNKSLKLFGFADGGTPRFSGGDNILAGFNANELVVDKTDTKRLSDFLDAQELKGSNQQRQAVTTQVTVPISIGQTELAKAIFQLNQDGYRTA